MTVFPLPNVLSIAGSDSSGGAGIQADLKTFAALGCYGMSVITAVTAQNTQGVTAVGHVTTEVVSAQIDAIFADIAVDVVKVGMLANAEMVELVARKLARLKQQNCLRHIVVDPVMVATSGDALLASDAIHLLKEQLFPIATVITPNLPEATALIGNDIQTRHDMSAAVPLLRELEAEYVLLKGGHLQDQESVDLLVSHDQEQWFASKRVATNNTHGTGCTLSSAIACGLATGKTVAQAVNDAKAYIQQALEHAGSLSVGSGHGPVNHFHQWYQRD